jgi:hypothetical protein
MVLSAVEVKQYCRSALITRAWHCLPSLKHPGRQSVGDTSPARQTRLIVPPLFIAWRESIGASSAVQRTKQNAPARLVVTREAALLGRKGAAQRRVGWRHHEADSVVRVNLRGSAPGIPSAVLGNKFAAAKHG